MSYFDSSTSMGSSLLIGTAPLGLNSSFSLFRLSSLKLLHPLTDVGGENAITSCSYHFLQLAVCLNGPQGTAGYSAMQLAATQVQIEGSIVC